MRDVANDLLLKLLKTPAVAEQIKKNLVNRDISIKIDGKEYQIMTKQPSDDDLTKLKAENWDLREALTKLASAADYIEPQDRDAGLNKALEKAWSVLGTKK